jgi:monomeric sarcosine oxidase
MHYQTIVIGTGGIGSAALYQLARRGVRVLGLDRFPPGHDRGSSHGQTRMIRQAYFEHPDYVPLALESYRGWAELEERRQAKLYHEVGLLEIGPAGGVVVPGVLESAERHRLKVESLSARDVSERFPGFVVPEGYVGVYEHRAGYLPVEQCVVAHIEEAVRLGAESRTGETVQNWRVDGSTVHVVTDRDHYSAERLVVAAGSWASEVLKDLGMRLEVRRKPQYWFRPTTDVFRADRGCPAYLYETGDDIFYGFPFLDQPTGDNGGMKVAEHTGGAFVSDPLNVNRDLDRADQSRVEAFLSKHLPGVSHECVKHAVCMYTLTPDQHFVVDRHPEHSQVVFVAGLSGHGFKFAPVLGQALADLALDGRTSLPIGFLNCRRSRLR